MVLWRIRRRKNGRSSRPREQLYRGAQRSTPTVAEYARTGNITQPNFGRVPNLDVNRFRKSHSCQLSLRWRDLDLDTPISLGVSRARSQHLLARVDEDIGRS